MPPVRRRQLTATLRQRLLHALQIGAVAPGDRLPGTRELAEEFGVDPRLVTAAYHDLGSDGLVELRPRSGVYVHPALDIVRKRPRLSNQWMAQVFAQGIARGVRLTDLPKTLSTALGGMPVRATVIASTTDQVAGLCRELHDDFGMEVRGVLGSTLSSRQDVPWTMRRSPLWMATDVHVERVTALAQKYHKRFVQITMRRDLFETEWAPLRGQTAFVIVEDTRFARMVHEYLQASDAVHNIHVLIAGTDDLSQIPADAFVYATQAARDKIGAIRLPKGLLPPARMLAEDCIADIIRALLDQTAGDGGRTAVVRHTQTIK